MGPFCYIENMSERKIPRESKRNQTEALRSILDKHQSERVVVVGTTCTGKSTLINHLPDAKDMDKLVFPLLTKRESDYVNQTPWTPAIGETMTRITRERVSVKPGKPIFGTVVLDADLIVFLKISDELLRKRTEERGVNFDDAINMQRQIEFQITESGLPIIEFDVG